MGLTYFNITCHFILKEVLGKMTHLLQEMASQVIILYCTGLLHFYFKFLSNQPYRLEEDLHYFMV